MALYEGRKYTKSDRAKYLVVIGVGFVGVLLVVANLHLLHLKAIIMALSALFWLGIIVLTLIAVLGRFFTE